MVADDCEISSSKPNSRNLSKGKASEVLAYRVREHNKITSQTMTKKKREEEEKRKQIKQIKQIKQMKQNKTNDRCFEECDAISSERKGKVAIARGTPYVLRRNRYLLHGQKQHEEDNCCCTDKTTRRR